jgi:hypothetical protein
VRQRRTIKRRRNGISEKKNGISEKRMRKKKSGIGKMMRSGTSVKFT